MEPVKKFALLVGVDLQIMDGGYSSLNNASTNDVEELAKILSRPEFGFEVFILINPSLSELWHIEGFFKNATTVKAKTILFYFSGHGDSCYEDTLHFILPESRRHAGLPFEAPLLESTALSAQTVKNWIEKSKAQEKIVLLDCCQSGKWGYLKGDPTPAQIITRFFSEQKGLGKKVNVITSCGNGNSFTFVKEDGTRMSKFTYSLIKLLREWIDEHRESSLTIDYIKKHLIENFDLGSHDAQIYIDGGHISLSREKSISDLGAAELPKITNLSQSCFQSPLGRGTLADSYKSITDCTKSSPWINEMQMEFVPVSLSRRETVFFCRWPVKLSEWELFLEFNVEGPEWREPKFRGKQTGDHPVCNICKEHAKLFLFWLNIRYPLPKELKYRLAKDAEWSVAVGQEQYAYPWKNEIAQPDSQKGHGFYNQAVTGKVCQFCENQHANIKYGICDMGGNVWEWVEGQKLILRGSPTGTLSELKSIAKLELRKDEARELFGFRIVIGSARSASAI